MPKIYPQSDCKINNCTFICMPWEKFALRVEGEVANVTVNDCLFAKISWRQWLASLFTHKIILSKDQV